LILKNINITGPFSVILDSMLMRIPTNASHAIAAAVGVLENLRTSASKLFFFEKVEKIHFILFRSCAANFYLESGSCRETCHDGFYPDNTGNLKIKEVFFYTNIFAF